MPIIQLQHDPRLAYSSRRDLPALSQTMLRFAENNTIISFRDSNEIKPATIYKNLNACSRYIEGHHVFPKENLIFCGIETDSPLAALILWDAAHQLPIHSSITLIDDHQQAFLEREYFSKAFIVEKRDQQQLVLRKIAPLLAEEDAGLDRWSFCIPAGPSDPAGLNMVVKRILELDIPEKEILLCGRPDENFQYWDQVRIVGEDIPAPPIWITKKKNVLAQEAQYENLCILHDRVFLPANFMQTIRQFGDGFSFAAFQSLWFDNVLNLSAVRYSDYGCAMEDHHADFIHAEKETTSSSFTPFLFTEIEKQNFIIANPLRYQSGNYLTGSLYITKRKLWLNTPQDESLYWAEFEDIEHADRCSRNGIPHRIIPGAFTQTLFARPLLYPAGYSTYLSANGKSAKTRNTMLLPGSILKPLIKLSEAEANTRLARFAAKYSLVTASKLAGETNMMAKIIAVIRSAEFPFNKSALNEFIDDIERDILCDQLGFNARQYLIDEFIRHQKTAKVNLMGNFCELKYQFVQRPQSRRFYQNILEYFPVRSLKIRFGTCLSALRLARKNGDYFYHPEGFRGYYKAILESTPFIDYQEKKS